MSSLAVVFIGLVLGVAGGAIYFLPSIIAWRRHKKQFMPIFIINALLGWTLLGWVAAMAWANAE